jgi:hypothetical protein
LLQIKNSEMVAAKTAAKKICFDTESDELALEATVMHILCAEDMDSGEEFEYIGDDMGWVDLLESATHLVGQNLIGHDLPLLKKLFGWTPRPDQKIQDTMIMSMVLDYKRFGEEGHSVRAWGQYYGDEKVEHEDWSEFSEEMRQRCRKDVKLQVRMYNDLMAEFKRKSHEHPLLGTYLLCENAAAKWIAQAHMVGWPFDKEWGLELATQLEEAMAKAEERLVPILGKKTVAKDKCKGVVDVKKPKWIAAGCYDAHTANWFGVDPWSGFEGEEVPIWGEYCRVEIRDLKLSSTDDVKIFLFRQGWVPFEWNTKWDPETKKKKRTSPKITEDSLEFLGGDGKLYREYSVAKSRLANLMGWLEALDGENRLHGDAVPIGTPSMRARHQIIVNIPAMHSKWGPEMRRLFIAKPGWKLVGCDSAGNQGRGLAYYLKNKDYVNVIVNEDIHIYNALKFEEALTAMGHNWREYLWKQETILKPRQQARLEKFLRGRNDITMEDFVNGRMDNRQGLDKTKGHGIVTRKILKHMRSRAKRMYYAFLFGAGGAKLWGYAFGTPDEAKGTPFKNGFIKAVPGFKALTDGLKSEFGANKQAFGNKKGFIMSLAGNRIYVDSYHKLLVYLLQAAEKITCSAACYLLMQYLEEEEIPYEPVMFMHDELDFLVPEEHAERAAELGVVAFTEGPKMFGIDIMTGEGKIGDNWAEVH